MANQKKIRIVENTYIELSDGVKLSTRLWLPASAEGDNPVPAIFEFLPYRKRDMTAQRDEINYQVFADNGYAGIRVDMRGCGDSTGQVMDPCVLQEQKDAVECINWIKQQPWCTGSVGMMGIAWGGFNSLQVAFHAPDALKAVIAIGFTDDRYETDVHLKGGHMLMDNIKWAAIMEVRYRYLPPDPLITENWKEVWLNRLENLQPALNNWLLHPLRDDHFKQGSISEDITRITTPAFLIAGMADGYSNNVTKTLEGLVCPKRALIGPWVNLYPNQAEPGPRWDYCGEAIKWWNKWLKGNEEKWSNVKEPELVLFIQNRDPADPRAPHVDGKWISHPKTQPKIYYLNNGKLGDELGVDMLKVHTKETVGFFSGSTTLPTKLGDILGQQSADDMDSCFFDTEAFSEEMSFCGNPIVHMPIASDKPVASVFVRLCKVDAAGKSIILSYTAWNLTHDASHETVTPLKAGQFQEIDIKLEFVCEKIEKGSVLRLCFTTALFPLFVPNPEYTTLTLDLRKCSLTMPQLVEFTPYNRDMPEPLNPQPNPTTILSEPYDKREVIEDEITGQKTFLHSYSSGRRRIDSHGLITELKSETRESILPDDPTSLQVNLNHQAEWCRGEDWRVEVTVTTNLTLDKDFFFTEESRTVKHGEEIIFSREFKNKFDRTSKT